MRYFDFHVHPSLKAMLCNKPKDFTAWSEIRLKERFRGVLRKFADIIESQANLRQLRDEEIVSVTALIGVELAFARNFAIQKIMASRKVSSISRQLLLDVEEGRKTHLDTFEMDLKMMEVSKEFRDFTIIKSFAELDAGRVNVVLSIEGAHSFQDVSYNSSDEEKAASIIEHFTRYKDNADYRFPCPSIL